MLPYWTAFALSFLGYVIYGATLAGQAALMEYLPAVFGDSNEISGLFDTLYPVESAEQLRAALPLFIVVLALSRGLGSYLGGYYIAMIGRNLVHDIRQHLFRHINDLPVSYFNTHGNSSVISLIIYNVEQITAAATDALRTLVREGLTVIALLVFLLSKNWKLTLVFLLVAPLIGVVVSLASRFLRKYSRRIQSAIGRVTQVTSETVRGISEVKIYGAQNYEQNRFKTASESNLRQSLKLARVTEVSSPLVQILTFISLAVLVWIGLSPQLKGSMDTGDFLAYITAAAMITRPLRQLTGINTNIQKGIAAAESIFATLDEAPEPDEGKLSLDRARGEIEFRDLSFTYPGADTPALRNISLHIAPGQTLALVGRSGAGKSTLVSLVARHNLLPDRQLYLDGQPVEKYRLQDLRRQIAMVSQQIVLFKGSVLDNIAYGELEGADPEAVIRAARSAHAMEFIESLPQGMETQIGEDGAALSGGQRQRLALARAFLKDTPIVILDEATSALDAESERYIQDALEEIMATRTTLVIAHRLSTIERADRIAVIDQGEIVETGTHSQLLEAGGAYAELYRNHFENRRTRS